MSDVHETAEGLHKGGENHEILVDELTTPEDYWLSVTDAARVTRRQEITIRRWIAAGELPVRRQRMGLNKRTRHVRASDLARLTPIIDPTATITGAPANADLLSIPIQQAQLLTTQQSLLQRLTPIEVTVAALVEQQEIDHEVQAKQHQMLEALQQAIETRFQQADELAQTHQRQLFADLGTQLHAMHVHIEEHVQREAETRQAENENLLTSLATMWQAMAQWNTQLDELQRHMEQEYHHLRQQWVEDMRNLRHDCQTSQRELSEEIEQRLTTAQQEWSQQVSQLASQYAALELLVQAEHRQQGARRRQHRWPHLRSSQLRGLPPISWKR